MNTRKITFLIKITALVIIYVLTQVLDLSAQNTVTFKINLQPQLKDSVFIPKNGKVYLKGNVFPLSPSKKIYLSDEAPIDSVYQASVNFPSSAAGKELQYNFFLYLKDQNKEMKEQMSRHLRLPNSDEELDALYFNSFAW